jgi:hypothetical protein
MEKFMLMRRMFWILAISQLLWASPNTDHVVITEPASRHQPFTLMRYVDAPRAVIDSPDKAGQLVTQALSAGVAHDGNSPDALAPIGLNPNAVDFFCLVHIIRWKDPDAQDPKKPQAMDKQNWYVYHAGNAWRQEDFTDRNRITGSKNLWLLFIQINARANYSYDIRYEFDLADLTPAHLQHGLGLIQLFAGAGEAAAEIKNYWGMYRIQVKHVPNEMSATAEAVPIPDKGDKPQAMGSAVKFVNEGLYRFDFGVAVPIRKISQVQVDSTNGVLTRKSADTTNAFGIIDLYPYKVDVRNTNFSWIPYVIGGAKIGSQPLHNILLGVGWGPKFAQFYVGALFVKQQQTGTAAQPSVRRTSYEPQVSFGLNMSIKGFTDASKKTK